MPRLPEGERIFRTDLVRRSVMSKKLVCLAAVIFLFGMVANVWAVDAVIFDTNVPPAIDGDVDTIWAGANAYPYDYYTHSPNPPGPPPASTDISGTWRALWDSNCIYYLIDVNDDVLVHDSLPTKWWHDDCPEIYIDADNSKGTEYDKIDDFKYSFRWNDLVVHPGSRCPVPPPDPTLGITFAMVVRTGGYRLEVKIPWTTLKATPYDGKLIGAGMAINDDDDGGNREIQVISLTNATNMSSNPSVFPTAELMERAKARDPDPADQAQGVAIDAVLSWTPGDFAADVNGHHVYFGTDFDDVNDGINDANMGVQSPTSYVPESLLEFNTMYYWRIDEVNDPCIWRGRIWSFKTEAGGARNPNPADGAIDVTPNVVLSWGPGEFTADINGHEIYLGLDFNDVNDATVEFDPAGVYMGARDRDPNSYDPCGLDCGRTYYWRIDEVNDPCVWPGDVWSFTVRCDQVVRGFIDSNDIGAFAERWLADNCLQSVNPSEGALCCGADDDQSGSVDFSDFSRLAQDWLAWQRLGDLWIPAERVPEWNPGVEGGMPDTSGWPVYCDATHVPYNADGNDSGPTASDVTAINNAINAAAAAGGNQVVYLPAGTFRFNSGQAIYMKSNVVLRGAGWDDTIIQGDSGAGSHLAGLHFLGGTGSATSITSNPIPRGTATITVSNAASFSVGDWVYMSQDNDPAYMQVDVSSHPGMTAIFKVAAKNGNTITMDRPLRHAFNPSEFPKIREIYPVKNAGIEKFKIEMDWGSSNNSACVAITNTVNCWANEVFFKQGGKHHIFFTYSARNTVFKCMFMGLLRWERDDEESGNYAMEFAQGAHDNLATNTVAINNKSNMCFSRGASGNVYSYNHHIGTIIRKGVQFHGKYPHSNLVEGNETYNGIMTMDDNWGQQGPRNTIFRNRCTGTAKISSSIGGEDMPPDANWPTGLDLNLMLNSAYGFYGSCSSTGECSYVGGNTHDYDFKHTGLWAEYNFARDTTLDVGALVWGWVWQTPEPTSVRIESDYQGDSAPGHWAGLNFPASLYLTEAPDWWPGGKDWPCIGADIDDHGGTMTKLPAQEWYDALSVKPY